MNHAGQWLDSSTRLDKDSLTFDGAYIRFMVPGFVLNVTNNLTVKGTDVLRHKLETTNAVVNCGSILLNKAVLGMLGGGAGVPVLNCQGGMMVSNAAAFRVYAGVTTAPETPGAFVDVQGDLVISHTAWVYPYSHPTNGGSVKFTVGNLRIPTQNTGINATGLGFWGGRPKVFTEIPLAADRFEGWGPGRGKNKIAAGHGGIGWDANATHGRAYGSAAAPLYPGSGGGYNERNIYGSNGGGAVHVVATGDVVVEGSILADADQSAYAAGGGAGGSVSIVCDRILGTTGLISAHGSDRAQEGGPCGGGGRIAVAYDPAQQAAAPLPGIVFNAAGGKYRRPSGDTTMTAALATGFGYGEVGTLHFPDDQLLTRNTGFYRHSGSWVVSGLVAWSPADLVISNGWFCSPVSGFALTADSLKVVGTDPMLHRLDLSNGLVRIAGEVTLAQAGMRLYGGAPLAPDFQCGGDLTLANFSRMRVHSSAVAAFAPPNCGAYVESEGTMLLSGSSQIWPYADATNGVSPFFEASSLTVADADSGFDATGFGYAGSASTSTPGWGPGAGYKFMGGGHGGNGSKALAPQGLTNDVANLPILAGSGGGANTSDSRGLGLGSGGGSIRIRVAEDAVVNGKMLAGGGVPNLYGGAGAGGTIFIDCRNFSGGSGGVLNATGANGNVWGGAGGGGGRIAVWYGVLDEDRDRVIAGDMKRVQITTTHPDYLGTATAAGGFDGSGNNLLTTGGGAGTVVFLTVVPPAESMIIVR